jgi:uncharacterized membrane protein
MPSRYQYIKIIKNSIGKRYYTNNIYPQIPISGNDYYVITSVTDRLDLLANDFYGDPSLYWVIAAANNISGDSLVPEPGTQLRIPFNIETAINAYTRINQNN